MHNFPIVIKLKYLLTLNYVLTIMFFRDGTMENRVTITPFTVIGAFIRAAYRMEVKESIFVTMKCC